MNQDKGEAIAIDSSGRIHVSGWSTTPSSDRNMVTWRYEPDGIPDRTFGGRGFVVYDNSAGGIRVDDHAVDMVLDCAGGILMAGYSRAQVPLGADDMVVVRFDSSGSLDPMFGTAGVIIHDGAAGGSGDDRAQAIALDEDGRIVLTGFSENPGNIDEMVVWRYE